MRVWDANTGREVAKLQTITRVNSCEWSPDGSHLASCTDHCPVGPVCLWDAHTGNAVAWLKGHSDNVYSCAWSPNGGQLVTASRDRTVHVWDVGTGQEVGRCRLNR